jgi:hypothetical protein
MWWSIPCTAFGRLRDCRLHPGTREVKGWQKTALWELFSAAFPPHPNPHVWPLYPFFRLPRAKRPESLHRRTVAHVFEIHSHSPSPQVQRLMRYKSLVGILLSWVYFSYRHKLSTGIFLFVNVDPYRHKSLVGMSIIQVDIISRECTSHRRVS